MSPNLENLTPGTGGCVDQRRPLDCPTAGVPPTLSRGGVAVGNRAGGRAAPVVYKRWIKMVSRFIGRVLRNSSTLYTYM